MPYRADEKILMTLRWQCTFLAPQFTSTESQPTPIACSDQLRERVATYTLHCKVKTPAPLKQASKVANMGIEPIAAESGLSETGRLAALASSRKSLGILLAAASHVNDVGMRIALWLLVAFGAAVARAASTETAGIGSQDSPRGCSWPDRSSRHRPQSTARLRG